jgi:putative transposase
MQETGGSIAPTGDASYARVVAFLLADLGVTKTYSRPYTPSDHPYSESNFKTDERARLHGLDRARVPNYRLAFPDRFNDIEHARAH